MSAQAGDSRHDAEISLSRAVHGDGGNRTRELFPAPPSDWAVGIPLCTITGVIKAFTLVDPDVYEWASEEPWRVHKEDEKYARHLKTGQFLHRLIVGLERGDPQRTDHIDGDRLNNTRANLRIVTDAQNAQNQGARKNSTSLYRGVSWNRAKKKWYAQCTLSGKNHNLGWYHDEKEAALAAAEFRSIMELCEEKVPLYLNHFGELER